MKFIFVKHGSTDWNQDMVLLGPLDFSLNDSGRSEATEAALQIKKMAVDGIILSSPLRRAKETAEIISKHCNYQIHTLENLKERYYGDYRLLKGDSLYPPDAESDEEFSSRIQSVFDEVMKIEKTPIIASHLEVFRQFMKIISSQERDLRNGGVHTAAHKNSI